MKRKPISSSLRWSVFARDGFACRYCGSQAGQDGVELHADHVVSVADGGDNSFDNLVTACQKCNGGKGARSISNAPTSAEVISRLNETTRTLREQADAINAAIQAKKQLEQSIVNLKCQAYGVDTVDLDPNEITRVAAMCRQYGSDLVFEWYQSAAAHGVPEYRAIRYLSGCIKNYRDKHGLAGGGNHG